MIGLLLIAIIVVPVITLVVAFVLGSPGTLRVPGLFIGSLILQIGAIIVSFAVLGAILGLIVPQ